MGRRGGHRGRGPRKPGNQWTEGDMHNEKMETFYRAQNILPDKEELAEHFEAFRRPLPTTFRITGSRENAVMMRDYMQRSFIPYLTDRTFEGKPLNAPEAIDWYPDGLAYQLDVPKQAVRKNAEFQAFQKFLVQESGAGNLVRQEVVSMVPPLLMNIKPDSTCLDMCAAPGSKTSQMVEYLHNGDEPPTGFVLANDKDYKRAYMLVHQVKRLNSPNFLVASHDATFLTNFYTAATKSVQKFDRVLVDVPCSGDGTLRKNFDIWNKWDVSSGLLLHPTQVNCLRRGLQMLAVGGRLVYSTCSLNPMEDEAVLYAVLSQVGGAAHLVDVSDQLPTLKRRPGLRTWKAVDLQGNFIQSLDEVQHDKHRFPTTIFPPSVEEAEKLHLERAMRFYPHLGNTGGFFVAVIDKTKEIGSDFESVRFKSEKRKDRETSTDLASKKIRPELPSALSQARRLGQDLEEPESGIVPDVIKTSSSEAQVAEAEDLDHDRIPLKAGAKVSATHKTDESISKSKFIKSLNDEYFKFLPKDHPDVLEIAGFYNLSKDLDLGCFLTRNISGEPVRSLYYASPNIKNLLVHNEGRVKFVHAGVKVFHRQNVENLQDGSSASIGMCKWRIAQDGVELLKDVVGAERIVHCTLDELVIFMQHDFPRASLFPNHEGSVTQQLAKQKYGCYLLRCDLSQDKLSRVPEVITVPVWKSKVTIQMMISRQDKVAIYTRITGKELPAAVKVDGETAKQLQQQGVNDLEIGAELSDQAAAIDTIINDAVVREEEGVTACDL